MAQNIDTRMTAVASLNDIVHQAISYTNRDGDQATFYATKGLLETPENPDWIEIVEGGFDPVTGAEVRPKVSFYGKLTVPGQTPVKIRTWAFGEEMVERFRPYVAKRQVATLELKAAKLTPYTTDRGNHLSMTLMDEVKGQVMLEEVGTRPASLSTFAEDLFAALA